MTTTQIMKKLGQSIERKSSFEIYQENRIKELKRINALEKNNPERISALKETAEVLDYVKIGK